MLDPRLNRLSLCLSAAMTLAACTAASSAAHDDETGPDALDVTDVSGDADAGTDTPIDDTAPDGPDADAPEGDADDDVDDAATDAPTGDAGSLAAGNSPPVLATIGDRRLPVEASTVIEMVARDPDGDELEFFSNALPDGARFDKTSGVFAWVPPRRSLGRTSFVLFGVRDEHGAEDSQLVTLEVVENAESNPPVLDLPPDGLTWPAEQDHVWAVPVSDPDGDRLYVDLEPGAPAGMTLDDGLLAWRASAEDVGMTFPVEISARDRGGLSTSGTVRIRVEGAVVDTLPSIAAAPGDFLSVDLIPDREDAPREQFDCALDEASDPLPIGALLEDCTLVWEVTQADADSVHRFRFDVDLLGNAASPDVVRALTISVADTPPCSPVTEQPEFAVVLEFDDDGYADDARTVCSPGDDVLIEYNIILPADSRGVDVLLIHDNPAVVDLDLRLVCRGVDEASYTVSGEEFVSSDEVEGGADCRIDVESYGVVRATTDYDILVDARLPDTTPECEDDASNFDLLFAGDVLDKRTCPGAIDEYLVGDDVARVDLVSDEGTDLDLEVWAELSPGAERLVDLAISTGIEESIELDRERLEEGEEFLLRVVPFEVPATGAGYLLEGVAATE